MKPSDNPLLKDWSRKQVSAEQLRLVSAEGRLFAICDGTCDASFVRQMRETPAQDAVSLLAGGPLEHYWAVAPYLTRVGPDLLAEIEESWNTRWGIFIFSRKSVDELHAHFQKFLIAQMPDGTGVLFRFFDSGVLQVYLDSGEAAKAGFHAGILAFGWPEDEATTVITCPPESPDPSGCAVTPALQEKLSQAQRSSFEERCRKYLITCGAEAPGGVEAFVERAISYATNIGVIRESDIVCLLPIVLAWKAKNPALLREVLEERDLDGRDKVDVICEIAAFKGGDLGPRHSGLDVVAHEAAKRRLADAHKAGRAFVQRHPDGELNMTPTDAHWRKEWVAFYREEVCKRANVTDAVLGTLVT